MPTIPCCSPPSLCSDLPISNYSSEAPDAQIFIGTFYQPPGEPPLGSNWQQSWCRGVCDSTVSQAAADACAQRESVNCLSTVWPVTTEDPNNPNTFIDEPRPVFDNQRQTCDFTCPDGNIFEYVIPTGTFSAFSQTQANEIAHSDACNSAIEFRICIGELTASNWCLNVFEQATADCTGPVGIYTITIASGSLPPGVTFFQDGTQAVFSGTPTASGAYEFVLRAEDASGNSMEKSLTITITEILPASLANGTVGNAYSETLTGNPAPSGTSVWEVTSGSLPTGLSLNAATGAITGTPTVAGTFNFTITMTVNEA